MLKEALIEKLRNFVRDISVWNDDGTYNLLAAELRNMLEEAIVELQK